MAYKPPHFNDKGPDDYFDRKKEASFDVFIPIIIFFIMIALVLYFAN
jgi:hypothetical protein